MRIISRTVLILSVVSLFADVASEMLYPVIPVYLKEIGFSVFLIGILEGIVNFTAGISKGYFGKLSDEKGLRLPFVKLGYLLSTVSKPLIAVFTYPIWIFFVRTIDRLGKGVRTAARDALLSQEATKETKARVFGFHRSMDTVGAAIGPVIALLFLFFYPGQYQTLFYLAFIPGLLSILFIFLLKEKKQPVSTLGKGNFFSFFKYWKIASPEYRKVVAGLLLFALFNSSDIFLLLITKETIGNNTITLFSTTFNADTITIAAYIFYNLVYAAASYPMGVLADRLSYKKIILFGLALFAIVYGGFAFNPSVMGIFILFSIYGIYAAATEGVIKAWITNLAHKENTATAIGFYTSCESICTLSASILAGALWTSWGSTSTFIVTAVISIIVFIYLLLKIKGK
ncbi:MAG: MFS transporter [Chitinophagaceae bacterium]|jgi:MFS family permease|nr:MFS transporter [Chitinophagaceae bacterium]MBK7678483.1 MFS transporter [Chitinophagaceae bacterium]MBK8300165.1 MFS transporter [Chitinophagaceae bacterium]MBK9464208.1 MFS transporter [Chitinophagaceae bacterium]MBL0067118.1 MFS transporter [Chitinophagaceae bacterium]